MGSTNPNGTNGPQWIFVPRIDSQVPATNVGTTAPTQAASDANLPQLTNQMPSNTNAAPTNSLTTNNTQISRRVQVIF